MADGLLVFDLFAGTGSATRAFRDAGDRVVGFEMDPSFGQDHSVDVMDVSAEWLLQTYGRPDFVWASPPCTKFSVASLSRNWEVDGDGVPQPRNDETRAAVELVRHTLSVIRALGPRLGWIVENPRGMLRKSEVIHGVPRSTVTYCQYGDFRMKPTDLFGGVPGWTPRPPCKSGMTCHEAAPRGARTGTQSLKNAKERSMLPEALSTEIRQAMLGGTR
jgi:site-specific DNA-cytosine methylase